MLPSLLTREPIDIVRLVHAVSAPERGGVATFLGLVRNHHGGRAVQRLEYSAYEPMVEAEAGRLIGEAEARWPVRAGLVHRLGVLAIGDAAVAVAAAGAHRAEAFEACRYLIEELKLRLPIWKKEHYADGTVLWVDPTAAQSTGPAVAAQPAAGTGR
jgi:molybdopterin synthase catalytic subunit